MITQEANLCITCGQSGIENWNELGWWSRVKVVGFATIENKESRPNYRRAPPPPYSTPAGYTGGGSRRQGAADNDGRRGRQGTERRRALWEEERSY